MSLAQKIVISIIVIIIVFTVGGMMLGGIRSPEMATNGSRLYAPVPQGVTEETPSVAQEEKEVETWETGTEEVTDPTSRLVIKSGEFNIVVQDVVENAKKIIQYAQKRGGWVVQSNIQELEELPIATVTVRIPAKDFDEMMSYIRGLAAEVNYEKSEGQDVTEEYVDLQSELKNLKATEKQFLAIMKKARTIEEILRIQNEISKVRSEIENTKGRMLYLERSARMASITVNLALSEELLPVPPGEKWRPGYIAQRAWKNVVAAWRNISYAVINFFVYAVIWLPIVVIFYVIIWWINRALKKGKK